MAAKMDIRVFHECNGMHTHTYPQILAPIGQSMEICIGEEEYLVAENALCYIPADTKHECSFWSSTCMTICCVSKIPHC